MAAKLLGSNGHLVKVYEYPITEGDEGAKFHLIYRDQRAVHGLFASRDEVSAFAHQILQELGEEGPVVG